MKLKLTVEGKVLASVPLDATRASNEYYLKAFRRLLIIRYQNVLTAMQKEPVFCVEPVMDKHAMMSN
jgi:ABC-type transporter MlaC component